MKTTYKFILTAGIALLLAVLLAAPSQKAAMSTSRTDVNLEPIRFGYWESLFMIGQIQIDGKERHFISQIFKACYPEYSKSRFEEGFNEKMKVYCGSSSDCRILWTSENASSDEEQVEKWHNDWASKGYQEIYYSEPESIYYRGCK